MADRRQQYYRPYDSENESGADSDEESRDSWFSSGSDQHTQPTDTSDGFPNFRAFATNSQLIDAGGSSFSTIQKQLSYGTDIIGKNTIYSLYEPEPDPDVTEPSEAPALPAKNTAVELPGSEPGTNIIMIDSRYRDRQSYPQPTYFSLRLPRTYMNIKSINVSEIKLLTSFYYFRPDKGNTTITIHEKGRTTYTYEDTIQSTIVTRSITTGSYNINSLLSELTTQLNYTPLFFDFSNGINDFIGAFRSTGDFFLNFNQPGDFFFNTTTNLWIPNPTITTIWSKFWKTRYAGLASYSYDQVYLAYYYPVLSEYIQDSSYLNTELNLAAGIGIDPTVVTTEDVIARILYTFEGINPPDPVVLAVIKANIPLLDKYRLQHTFRYWLINKYVVGIVSQSQNVYITTPSLNTSLVTLLNNQQAKFLTQAITLNGLTTVQYTNLATILNQTLAVLQDMYTYEQTQFLNYFAVPWGQYTLPYYISLDYEMQLRDGIGAIGIPSNDAQSLAAGTSNYVSSILEPLRQNPDYYWPRVKGIVEPTLFMLNLSTVNTPASTLNFVYQYQSSNFNARHTITDSNNYLYSDYLTKSANVVCPIKNASYTAFKFISPVRQTLYIETLPRPSIYRLPVYNQSNFDSTINTYFDINYTFNSDIPFTTSIPSTGYTTVYDNLPSTNLIEIPGWAYSNAISPNPAISSWGKSYTSSFEQSYTSSIPLTVLTYNRALYFQFTTPLVSSPAVSVNSSFTYSLNLDVNFYSTATSLTTLSTTSMYRMFVYHDRAAFQGDVLNNRTENQRLYNFSTVIGVGSTGGRIQFTTYPQETYYCILRADSTNFGNSYTRVAPWFSNPFTLTQQTLSVAGINPNTDICGNNFSTLIQTNFNYAKVYDSNWIRLPITTPATLPDPSSNAGNINVAVSNIPIGYDNSNSVSTDYTDYIPYTAFSTDPSIPSGFNPIVNLGIDPITQYQFQSNSQYNSTTTVRSFFYTGSQNSIFQPGLVTTYTPSTIIGRQAKIAHYYSLNYLPESDSNFPLTGLIDPVYASNAQLPYTISTTQGVPIQGYSYGSNSNIQLSRGVLGFNFIPEEGVWNIDRIVFRSAIYDSNNDPNSNIKYLGVYNMCAILGKNTNMFTISSAITVLSNSATVSYTSNTNFGARGFDMKGGTYYEFKPDTSFIQQVPQSILGYHQTSNTLSDQPESMYTCIAFNQYGAPVTIKALSGSAIPYPLYNSVYTSNAYFDGTKPYNSTFGLVFPSTIGQSNWPIQTGIFSNYGPSQGGSPSQSQFVLSMPIGTSVVNYKNVQIPRYNSEFLLPWTTSLQPVQVFASVYEYYLLQDTNYTIYNKTLLDSQRAFSTPSWTLSEDDIFPSYETTSLVSISGNSSNFYFLGLSNVNNTTFRIRMKEFNPVLGQLNEYPLNDISFVVPLGGTVKSFTINDQEQFVLCYQDTTNTTRFYYTPSASTFLSSYTIPYPSTAVHSMDPTTSTLYWLSLDPITNTGSNLYKWSLDGTPGTTPWTFSGAGTPSRWNGLAVTSASNVPASNDRIYLYSQTVPYASTIYYSLSIPSPGNPIPMVSISTVLSGPVQSILPGYKGGLWATVYGSPIVWGTRNSDTDIIGTVDSAWQIFYPFQKIVMTKVANTYNAITDLAYLNYPEYPHTQMFYYSNESSFLADTSGKWGLESSNNFKVADTNFSGYYFNSYMFSVPVTKSTSPTDYKFLSVRGYTPTESSEPMIRFVVPNRYDFGYPTQLDLINEIALYQQTSNQSTFNVRYGYTISNFDIAFQQSNNFYGQGIVPNFNGSNIQTSNFQQFASSISSIYAGYIATASTVNGITDTVNSNMNAYIGSVLQYIIPASAGSRQNFTDPLTFSILFKSSLLPQYTNLLDNWGLGYNLGYAKVDTPYSTYAVASSFYKILDDYIYLRLNPEYKLNCLDTTAQENFSVTRDSTGQINDHFGKLLLNNFNTYSTTFLSNQVTLNPIIGKLEAIYFQWVNIAGTQINDTQCEWTASVTVVENKTKNGISQKIPNLPLLTNPKKK